MINIIRSVILTLIGLASLGWISIWLIIVMLYVPDNPDGFVYEFFSEYIVDTVLLENLGYNFADVADGLFKMVNYMTIALFSITTLMALSWSTYSHYLNIDAPGKAKIYFIHWAVFSVILVIILLGVITYFIISGEIDEDIISTPGYIIFCFSALFYFLMYYIGVLLGTARFARSAVLFANKLPGDF